MPDVGKILNRYAPGNCTWYVASRFPNISPSLHNAKDWIANGRKAGYPILTQPHAGTVVVYGAGNGYSALGHVAVVDQVNSDGSFQVTEMNYRGYNVVDNRRSTMRGVIGFLVPPGSPYKSTADALIKQTAARDCVTTSSTFGPFVPGGQPVTICWDGIISTALMGAGASLMIVGVLIFVAFTFKGSGIGSKAAGAAAMIPGPWGKVAAVASSATAKKEEAPTPNDAKAASDERMSKARGRIPLSPNTDKEVQAAKRGEGSKLSPAARQELKEGAA